MQEEARALLSGIRARLRIAGPADLAFLQKLAEDARGCEPPTASVVRTLQSIGLIQSNGGSLEAAAATLEEALRIEMRLRSNERRHLLTSRHGLAMLAKQRGALGEAELLARRALDETRVLFGNEHPHVATCLQGMGTILVAKGDARRALPYLERALALKQRLYGDEHPSTASAFHELGKAWTELGDFERAERLLDLACEHRRRSLGERSPDLAEALDAIGRLRQKQGRHAEAEVLFRKATEIRAAALGPEHPETLESVQGLSQVVGAKKERREPLQGFLDDLRERTSTEPWPISFTSPIKYLYDAQRSLWLVRELARWERERKPLPIRLRGALWLVLVPTSALLEQMIPALERTLGGGKPPPRLELFCAIVAVQAAAMARVTRRRKAPDLARAAIDRTRAAFGLDHPFTREVEAILGSPGER
jgi:tetratricopeptide (TPR) repeat protein